MQSAIAVKRSTRIILSFPSSERHPPAITTTQAKPYGLLDLSSPPLDQDLLDVAVHVHELEGRIQELLDAAFAAAVGTTEALDLLVQFRSVLQVGSAIPPSKHLPPKRLVFVDPPLRPVTSCEYVLGCTLKGVHAVVKHVLASLSPHTTTKSQRAQLREDLQRRYALLLKHYMSDMDAVQRTYEKHKHKPPAVRSTPPVAANIQWARLLLQRLRAPMHRCEWAALLGAVL